MISKPECMCQLIAFPDGKWQLRSTLCHRSTSKEMIQVCYAISLNVLFFLLPHCRFWCNSNHVCFIEHFYPLFACLFVCLLVCLFFVLIGCCAHLSNLPEWPGVFHALLTFHSEKKTFTSDFKVQMIIFFNNKTKRNNWN